MDKYCKKKLGSWSGSIEKKITEEFKKMHESKKFDNDSFQNFVSAIDDYKGIYFTNFEIALCQFINPNNKIDCSLTEENYLKLLKCSRFTDKSVIHFVLNNFNMQLTEELFNDLHYFANYSVSKYDSDIYKSAIEQITKISKKHQYEPTYNNSILICSHAIYTEYFHVDVDLIKWIDSRFFKELAKKFISNDQLNANIILDVFDKICHFSSNNAEFFVTGIDNFAHSYKRNYSLELHIFKFVEMMKGYWGCKEMLCLTQDFYDRVMSSRIFLLEYDPIVQSLNPDINNIDCNIHDACITGNIVMFETLLNKKQIPTQNDLIIMCTLYNGLSNIIKLLQSYNIPVPNIVHEASFCSNFGDNKLYGRHFSGLLEKENNEIIKMKKRMLWYSHDFKLLTCAQYRDLFDKVTDSMTILRALCSRRDIMFVYLYMLCKKCQPDIICFENSLDNEDVFVFEYFHKTYNYIPSIVSIMKMNNGQRQLLTLARFYPELAKIEYPQ